MKFIILLVVGLAIFYFGYMFSSFYRKQMQIYKELIKFSEILASQIRFNKNILKVIVKENLNSFSSEFKNFLQAYFIEEKKDFTSVYLTNKDINQIKQFFNSLGKLDVDGEIKNIENQKTVLQLSLNEKVENEKKFGTLGTKLGALLGILICIVFI